MTTKSSLLLSLAIAVITILEMIGDVLSIQWLHYSCKPLIMAVLLWYVWRQFRSVSYPGSIRWLLVGMVFALVGDVLLMIQEVDLFAPGLGAFLVMQICYIIAFQRSVQQSGKSVQLRSVWLKAIPFVLYAGAFLSLLRPAFSRKPELVALWWPVVVYGLCLNVMGLMATLRQGLPGYWQVVIGALLFILSDSFIAIDKFLQPIMGATWLIMSTYAAAQYLIVTGIVEAPQPTLQSA